jgi:hypothetical protein
LDVTGANLLNAAGQNQATVAANQGSALSNLANQYYGGQAGLDTSQGAALSGLANQYYSAQAGLDTGRAAALSGDIWQGITPQVNAYQSLAQPTANTYQQAADAQMTGSKNLWNLGAALATGGLSTPFTGTSGASTTLGSQLMGGVTGGFNNLMSGFGGGGSTASPLASLSPNVFANPLQRA